MTKKQILNLLITHYEKVIVEIATLPPGPNQLSDARIILYKRGVDLGICHCAKTVFNEDITKTCWVDRHTQKFSAYWAGKPWHAWSISEMIELLQYRVDIMQKLEKESWFESFYKNVIYFFKPF